jgi:hypothetical protein
MLNSKINYELGMAWKIESAPVLSCHLGNCLQPETKTKMNIKWYNWYQNPELKNTKSKCNILWAGIAQSLQRLATGLTVRGSNPGGGDIFRTCPDRPWGSPSLLYSEYRVFPGGKATGAWRWPPTPSSTKVKERVELYLYSPFGASWLF